MKSRRRSGLRKYAVCTFVVAVVVVLDVHNPARKQARFRTTVVNDKSPAKESLEDSRELPACFVADTSRSDVLLQKQKETATSLPKPIINVGMPKVGSMALFDFFVCSGWKASHHWTTATNAEIGKCLRQAREAGQPLLATCDAWKHNYLHPGLWRRYRKRWDSSNISMRQSSNGKNIARIPDLKMIEDHGAEAYLQLDFADKDGDCGFPQMEYLEDIHREHPQATFILNFRPIQDWTRSVMNWSPAGAGGSLAGRFRRCQTPLPGLKLWPEEEEYANPFRNGHSMARHENLQDWWCTHVTRIREFVQRYPSHALIELDLYQTEDNARIMSELFGSSPSCWAESNVNKKLHRAL